MKMKKIAVLLLSLIMVLGIVVGCQPSEPKPTDPVVAPTESAPVVDPTEGPPAVEVEKKSIGFY
ncbi:MAG: hypothetical protein GX763_09225, partial [Clostridiaceae bacterium]|nr:hypothetical protein [Clostridiaceae bacterium]